MTRFLKGSLVLDSRNDKPYDAGIDGFRKKYSQGGPEVRICTGFFSRRWFSRVLAVPRPLMNRLPPGRFSIRRSRRKGDEAAMAKIVAVYSKIAAVSAGDGPDNSRTNGNLLPRLG